MATLPSLVSLADYLHTTYKPDVHFVDGELEERNVGKYDHSTFQIAIGSLLWSRRSEWAIHPMTEQRIQVSASRVRVCDILALRAGMPREDVTLTPPLLCIEILSPDDRLHRAKQVLADYLAMGVPHIWLIDPLRRAAYTFDAAGLHETDPTAITIPQTPITVNLTEAFAAID